MARRCKLCFLYKRPGQRVIINRRGDMLVRPTFIELTLNQTPLTTSVHDVSPIDTLCGISPSLVRPCKCPVSTQRGKVHGGSNPSIT